MKKDEKKTIEVSVDTIKNAVIIILIIVIIFGLGFLASSNSESYADQSSSSSSTTDTTTAIQQESESVSDDERKEIEEIDVDKYLDLMDESEASVIYVMRTGCSWCEVEDPIMENIVYKYPDARIYRLDIANFSGDDQSNFAKSDEMFSGDDWGTPTTVVVKNGKVVDSIGGATTSDNLIELFKNNKIISE